MREVMVIASRIPSVEAIRGFETHNFGFCDSQIWATARLKQILEFYSEDFNSGIFIEGVQFTNPFSNNFQLP